MPAKEQATARNAERRGQSGLGASFRGSLLRDAEADDFEFATALLACGRARLVHVGETAERERELADLLGEHHLLGLGRGESRVAVSPVTTFSPLRSCTVWPMARTRILARRSRRRDARAVVRARFHGLDHVDPIVWQMNSPADVVPRLSIEIATARIP